MDVIFALYPGWASGNRCGQAGVVFYSYFTPTGACPSGPAMLDARHRYRLGDSLAVELPTLTRTALVRIQVPQPSSNRPL